MTRYDVARIMGQNLADLLDTDGKLDAFGECFRIIASVEGDDLARAWMIGMNPHLDDEAPFLQIAGGQHDDAMVAARAYVGGVR